MAETTVRELADVVGIPVDRLLAHLGESGLQHTEADQRINDQEKAQLFTHLRRLHGKGASEPTAPRKITLKRKSVSELRIASPQGRRKTVTVETRRRRAYAPGTGPSAETAAIPAGEEGDARARMNAAKRALQEEAKRRQQELDETLRAEAEVREKEEALRKLREPEKKKRVPVEEPAPEPESETAAEAAAPEAVDAPTSDAAPAQTPAKTPAKTPDSRQDSRQDSGQDSGPDSRQDSRQGSRQGSGPGRAPARCKARRPWRRSARRPWPQEPRGAARCERQGGPAAQEAEDAPGRPDPACATRIRNADRTGRAGSRDSRDGLGG